MTNDFSEHVYVHVPFCDGRCRYCGFYASTAIETYPDYAPLPARELARAAAGGRPAPVTVYIGGGSPGCDARALEVLLASLNRVMDPRRLREWTVEMSPHQVDAERVRILARHRVTRVSIGVQSFDDRVLREMGRRHDAARVGTAVATLRAGGFSNISLDVIADWPTESPASFRAGLERALALHPEHLSLYSLSVEPGSELARSGTFGLLGDEAALARIALAETMLARAGVFRYEISNYARPGAECLHNLAVWRGRDYAGLGPSAASRAGRRRRENLPDLDGYLRAVAADGFPPGREETLSAEDDLAERFTTGLRLAEGVNPGAFRARHPGAAARIERWERQLEFLATRGLVASREGAWRLTGRGREVADGVLRELLP